MLSLDAIDAVLRKPIIRSDTAGLGLPQRAPLWLRVWTPMARDGWPLRKEISNAREQSNLDFGMEAGG